MADYFVSLHQILENTLDVIILSLKLLETPVNKCFDLNSSVMRNKLSACCHTELS